MLGYSPMEENEMLRAKLELVEKQRDAWRKVAEYANGTCVGYVENHIINNGFWELLKAARELMGES